MQSRKFIYIIIFSLISFSFTLTSCEEQLVGPEITDTPTHNFEYFWQTFDGYYGMFNVKNINWDSIYDQYRPQLNDQITEEQLYHTLCDMMVLLNDNHLNLYPTNGQLQVFPGGVLSYRNGKLEILKAQEDYDLEVVKKYLLSYQEQTPNILTGKLDNNIAYLNIKGTDGLRTVEKQMENVMAQIASAEAVIIDARGFYGGFDAVSQFIAGCFANDQKLYMTSRKRNGPNHNDFTIPTEWYAEPKTSKPFTKPVIVLTSRFTQSAGESFTLALKQYSYIKTIGDTTAGSFSDNPNFELPNGWIFSVSVGDYRAADGTSYEGIGIAPDIFVKTTKSDLLQGRDLALEKALEILVN